MTNWEVKEGRRNEGYECWYPHFTKITVLMKWEIDTELYPSCKGINIRIKINDMSILGRMWDVRVVWAQSSA